MAYTMKKIILLMLACALRLAPMEDPSAHTQQECKDLRQLIKELTDDRG